jgi:L-ascorbate metabolism protein UlaG (beta-lactamase superfamily)
LKPELQNKEFIKAILNSSMLYNGVFTMVNRRTFLKRMLAWCGMAAMPAALSACAGYRIPDKNRALIAEVDRFSLREIADRKLHHGDGSYLNLFGGPMHGNPWRPATVQSVNTSDAGVYNYSYVPYYKDQQTVPVTIDWNALKHDCGLSVTFVKHACVMIKDQDQYILVDPVLFGLPFVRDFTPLAFDIRDMPPPTHVLITHGHYDHLDEPSLKALPPQTHVITPLGYADLFKDLKMNNRSQLDWFDTFEQNGLKITLLPCKHWTMRNPIFGANHSLWGSFLLKTAGGKTIYISGDTTYFRGFREIGSEYDVDLAIINLGAYSHGVPWWMSHLNPSQAVRAFQDLQAKQLMIVHWGSYSLTSEPVHFPPIQLKPELEKAGLTDRLVHLNHGETLFYKV